MTNCGRLEAAERRRNLAWRFNARIQSATTECSSPSGAQEWRSVPIPVHERFDARTYRIRRRPSAPPGLVLIFVGTGYLGLKSQARFRRRSAAQDTTTCWGSTAKCQQILLLTVFDTKQKARS